METISSLDIWLKTYSINSTRMTNRSVIKNFMRFVFNEDDDPYDQVDRYLQQYRDNTEKIMHDIDCYWGATHHLAPRTRGNIISTLRVFFRDSYVQIPEFFWNKFSKRGRRPRPISKEKILTLREIKTILQLSRAMMTTLILTLVATGARIGEVLQVEISDLSLEQDPARIYLRDETTKNKESRVIFLTNEARDAIKDWLSVRLNYLQNKRGEAEYKQTDNPRVFPFSIQNAYVAWYNLLDTMGLDERDLKTGRRVYRFHGFRKFFRTTLASAGVPVDIVETILGHEGYLSHAYRRHSEIDLANWYKQGCHSLTVYSENAEVAKIAIKQKEENINLQEQLAQKERDLNASRLELVELKLAMTKLQLELQNQDSSK